MRTWTLLACVVVCTSSLQGQSDPIRTLQAALAAPPLDLARAYSATKQLLDILALAEGGGTIQAAGRTIDSNNVKDIKTTLTAQAAIYETAIRQRGYAHLAGRYHGIASPTCNKIQSSWTAGVHDGSLADVTIAQDSGFTIELAHRLVHDADTVNLKVAAVVVDSVITFVDPMNSDYVLIGQVSGGTITVRPDADVVVAAWPHWLKAPDRDDLRKCVVTLAPSARQ